MHLSEDSVELYISQENSAEYMELLHPQGVYDFMSETIMSCLTYAPRNVSVAGFDNRVGKSIGVVELLRDALKGKSQVA